MDEQTHLSRRERQIMDALYALGQGTVADVWRRLPQPPTRTAVRTMIGILEAKGLLIRSKDGREFVFEPTRKRERVGQSALRRVLSTFFDGSLEKAVAAFLTDRRAVPSPAELRRLQKLIRDASKESKP